MSAEPTAEQVEAAAKLHECFRARFHGEDYDSCVVHGDRYTAWPCDVAVTTARALAAAVTAEREKLRQAALDFDRRSDRSVGDRSAAFAEAAARLHFLAGDPA